MLKKLALALMLVCGLSHAQTTTYYQISDDGYAFAPLPFSFPYYGQTFNQSWMYDNGIISFVNPKSNNAVAPWEWSAPVSLSQAKGKYFIAALWADISPTNGTTYSTTTDGTYMKYNWNNISEFYSGGTRLNSFSATITPDGGVSTSYYSLNLQTSNVLAGTVGDPAKGEVYQAYSAPFGTNISTGTIPNWNYNLYDPCKDNPLYSSTCSGFAAALAKMTNTTSSDNTVSASSTTATGTVTSTIVDDPVNPTVTTTTTTTSTTSINVQPTSPTTTSTVTSTIASQRISTPTSGTSIGLSVIGKNQQREQNITASAVQNAITTSDASAVASQQEAISVASIAMSDSTSMSGQYSGTGIKVNASSAMNVFVGTSSSALSGMTENNLSGYNNMLLDRTNPLNEYVDIDKANLLTSSIQQLNKSAGNQNAGSNELEKGVDITKIAMLPNGYTDYLNLALKDSVFYASKTVYGNQRNVDNTRALRQLSNDSKHKDLVEMQYGR